MALPEELEPLGAVVARAAARAGVQVVPPDAPVHRCAGGCGAEVARRGGYCSPCAAAQIAERRRAALAPAYASVSPDGSLDWCRHAGALYREKTARALAAGVRLEEPTKGVLGAFVRRGEWPKGATTLTLLGPTGIGKTTCAIAFLLGRLDWARDRQLKPSEFATACRARVVSGLELARARAKTKLGEEAPLVAMAERAPLLLLDEIGFEHARHDPQAVRDVLYARRLVGRTIVTSGCTRAELATTYGDALVRRLEDLGVMIDLHGSAR